MNNRVDPAKRALVRIGRLTLLTTMFTGPRTTENHVPLECWLYTSRSLMTDYLTELGPLVEVSRRRNEALEVTGALIFTGSFFAQFLEGPAEGIAALKASIERDPRHTDVRTARIEPCEDRRFGAWTLAYANAAEPFDRLIAVARTMRGPAGQDLLLEMIHRFVEAPLD